MRARSIVAFPASLWDRLAAHMNAAVVERMGFGYCGMAGPACQRRYMVRELDLPDDSEYGSQNEFHVALSAEHVARRAVRARDCRAFLDVHSHPFAAEPTPSRIDRLNAVRQHRALSTWAHGLPLIRIIFGCEGVVWAGIQRFPGGPVTPVDEIEVAGPDRLIRIQPRNASPPAAEPARQSDVRTREVVGDAGITALRRLRVAVVGLGGTGSVASRLLAGAGVGELYCIDGDVIEAHNAPRLWYYSAGTESQMKATVAHREILRAFPDMRLESVAEPFPAARAQSALAAASVVVCCVDHSAVRFALACWCARRMIPLVDVGCGGRREGGRLVALGYQVRLQAPGGPCLVCNGLDTRQLEDPETTTMKQRMGYIDGGEEVSGELAVLTTRAAADAVDVVLRYVTGYVPAVPWHVRGEMVSFRTIDASDAYPPWTDCPLCGSGSNSVLGTGENWPGADTPPCPEGFHDAADQ